MLSSSKIRFLDFFLNWRAFLIFNILIFSIKILFSVYHNFTADFFEDWKIAKNLAFHGAYSLDLKYGSSAYKLPIYPLFLSFFIKIFGSLEAVKFIIITQHIFYFSIPILIIKIFENLNLKIAGFLSAYFFILSPSYFYYSNILEATNVFIFLFAVWIYLYSELWMLKKSLGRQIAFTVITAILALTQVVVIPLMILMILILCFYKRLSIKNTVVVLLAVVTFYSPWIIRNYFSIDKLIISKSPVWQNVYLGYVSDYQILPGNKFMTKQYEKNIEKILSNCDEFGQEDRYEKEVLKIVDADQWAPLKKGINNFISLWYVPKRYFDDNKLSIILGRKCYVALINVLLLVSLVYFFRNKKSLFFIFSVVFAGFTFPYLVGHAANIRFKLDFEWIQTSVISLFIFCRFLSTKKVNGRNNDRSSHEQKLETN